jgi:eukaryotic-like serine/threonine-protein kinase
MDLVNDSPRVLGNRYEVGELLGRGGMAEVHLGRDARLGRAVAIKLLRTDLARDSTFQARFRREAQSAAALNHPAIVAVYDTGEEQVVESGGGVFNLPYIVMEHIEGRTLRDVLAEGHHLDVDAALDIITGVLTALEYSHRIGIVHRDIKPANVMLTPVGDVKVMDFGIARAMSDASSTMTQTQAVIGTAQYLSPEQARGEQVDTRSDLYSAGCLLYELLTGRPPFVADSPVAVAYQHVREAPVPPSRVIGGIPDSVDRIVLHSLAKGRDERYQTAADFRADVEAARGGRQVSAVPVMHGSNATTQYVPMQDPTGTRVVPAGMAGAGLLGGDTVAGGQGADPYDPYNQNNGYGQNNEYARRRQEPEEKSNRNAILAGIATMLVVAIVAFIGYQVFGPVGEKDTGAGGTTVTVPEVVGQAQALATSELEGKGFKVEPKKAKSSDEEKGKVLSQDPAGETTAANGSIVTITVGSGEPKPTEVEVPDVAGKSQSQARSALKEAGLTVEDVRFEDNADVDPERVIRTDPAAGEPVDPKTPVTIYLATATASVPNVVNKTESQAKRLLKNAGFKVDVDTEVNGEVAVGRVVRTDPNQNSKLDRGSTVTIYLAEAPRETEAPTPPTSTSPPGGTPPSSSADDPNNNDDDSLLNFGNN